jgi:plastocyanin
MMKNIGLIGLAVAMVLVFGGYALYQITMPEPDSASLVTDGQEGDMGTQFLQVKPESLPPVGNDETGEAQEQNSETAGNNEGKEGEVSGVKDDVTEIAGDQPGEERKTEIDQPGVVISMTDMGFFPSMISVKPGTKVSFVNDGQALHWPASDAHPKHDNLSDFDAGSGLATGEVYVFQFDQVGEWGFHDHLDPKQTGKVVVE